MTGRTDNRIARYPRQQKRPDGAIGGVPTVPRPRTARSDATLRAYLDDIDRYPLLTAQRERELGERARAGDKAARETLISSNLRLVVAIARTYTAREMTLLDLIGEGNIGLVAAVDRYQPTKGARFASYAGWWIRQAISRAIAERDCALPLPQYLFLLQTRVQRTIDTYLAERGRGPTVAELCRDARVTVKQLRLLGQAPTAILSLDTPAVRRDDGPSIETLGDTLPAPPDAPTPDTHARVLALLRAHLTERECLVLALRLQLVEMPGYEGTDAPMQKDIAGLLGVSHQMVSLLELRARDKLRQVIGRALNGSVVILQPPTASASASTPAAALDMRPNRAAERFTQAALFGAA